MLSGRERESAAVAALLSGARHGRGGALVLVGEHGIGKSALLRHAFVSAEGMAVLGTAGADGDAPWAALDRLVRPRLAGARPPREAAGVVSLLDDPWPLLCLVDDAQWLDRESAELLVELAPRLASERVALLAALRDGAESPLLRLPALRVARLHDGDARELLLRRYPDHPPAVCERIAAEAHGNPLTLVELGAAAR